MVVGVVRHYVQAVQRFGLRETLRKMYMMGEIKFGEYQGEDSNGNKYYENTNYPHGQTRWVEYKDHHNFDSSSITAEWHGWIHHSHDDPPTQLMPKRLKPTTFQHDNPFTTHVGLKSIDVVMNKSTWRPRGPASGYADKGNLYQKPGEPEAYYKQPGHPSLPKDGRFDKQKHMGSWSPADPAGKETAKPIRPLEEN